MLAGILFNNITFSSRRFSNWGNTVAFHGYQKSYFAVSLFKMFDRCLAVLCWLHSELTWAHKNKVHPITRHEGPGRGAEEVYIYSFFNPEIRWGGWSKPVPAALPLGKKRVPIIQEAGWARGPLWTGAENLTPTGIRSQDRQVRSESNLNTSYTKAITADLYSIFLMHPGHNENLSLAEKFTVLRIQISSACMKRKLPATENNHSLDVPL